MAEAKPSNRILACLAVVISLGYLFIFLTKFPAVTRTSAAVVGYGQNILTAGVLSFIVATVLVFFFTVKK